MVSIQDGMARQTARKGREIVEIRSVKDEAEKRYRIHTEGEESDQPHLTHQSSLPS